MKKMWVLCSVLPVVFRWLLVVCATLIRRAQDTSASGFFKRNLHSQQRKNNENREGLTLAKVCKVRISAIRREFRIPNGVQLRYFFFDTTSARELRNQHHPPCAVAREIENEHNQPEGYGYSFNIKCSAHVTPRLY